MCWRLHCCDLSVLGRVVLGTLSYFVLVGVVAGDKQISLTVLESREPAFWSLLGTQVTGSPLGSTLRLLSRSDGREWRIIIGSLYSRIFLQQNYRNNTDLGKVISWIFRKISFGIVWFDTVVRNGYPNWIFDERIPLMSTFCALFFSFSSTIETGRSKVSVRKVLHRDFNWRLYGLIGNSHVT